MINDLIITKNEKDISGFLDNIDNVDYLLRKIQKFDGNLIKLKLEGENFKSSLTGSLIIGLAKFQEKIRQIYIINKYGPGVKRKLTPEEAKILEIKVTVNNGSTEAIIEIAYKAITEAMKSMSPDQIQDTLFGLAAIITGGICLIGIGSKVVTGFFKTRRKTLALKKTQSNDETEKKRIESQESVLMVAIEAVREVSNGIVQAKPKLVAINDKEVTTDSIISAAADLEQEKPEVMEEHSVITGTYKIQRITLDFKKDTASTDVLNVKNGDHISGIIVQPKSISDGSFRVLKTAQDKHDVKLQLIITKRNDKIYRAVLDKILE